MRVNLATQVLSHSVAAGITTMVTLGALPKEANHTALFLDKFDRIFDTFNSQTLRSTSPYRSALSKNYYSVDHIKFLKDSYDWLNTIQPGSASTLPCLEGWKLDISALIQLWEELQADHGFEFLLTSRLNQDCLENLFSTIRGRGGQRDNPTSVEFRAAFARSAISSLTTPVKSSNCQPDVDTYLFSAPKCNGTRGKTPRYIHTHAQANTVHHLACSNQSTHQNCDVPFSKDTFPNLHSANVLTYIAGYMVKRLGPEVCSACRKKLPHAHQFHTGKNCWWLIKRMRPPAQG